MIMNLSFEEQLLRLISEAKTELEKKRADLETISNEITKLTAEKQGYETALRGYHKRIGKPEKTEIDWQELLKDAETHKDEIVGVTKQLGGLVRPNQLTDILYSNGFIKSKKRANAYQIVQTNLTALVDGQIMEKVDGQYRLLGQADLPLRQTEI